MPIRFQIGQRWSSESEPELGLGTIRQFNDRTVTVGFGGSGEVRQYAIDNAPLRRARFRQGDHVQGRQGAARVVDEVSERNGLLYYRTDAGELPEHELSDQISASRPDRRLWTGQCGPTKAFDLRRAALQHQHDRRKSKVRGFVGGRIELIPHQLYIASEVTGRLAPRVLLADEVGLGKTIEACLILHRLVQTGRVQRALILVPDSLVHQWFVELLRRFNLWFHIFDEERCDAIETVNPEANPFLDDQWVLCGIDFLAQSGRRRDQALDAGWDVLVVDEAHHLGWSPDLASPEYALVETLGSKTPGLLLLTATPEQLGIASHFARLRLLDPDRYYDLAQFLEESTHYQQVAEISEKVMRQTELDVAQLAMLAGILQQDASKLKSQLARSQAGDSAVRQELIDALLDCHGTGRVMFRNRRASMTGFPPRVAHLHSIPSENGSDSLLERLALEFGADTSRSGAVSSPPLFPDDPRILWLSLLLKSLETEKVLLICRSSSKVLAIAEALSKRMQIRIALFHEGLPLVQRDRNAAWFAEEDGARILVASEIGSEGRNFQFAHHLVLFDLPLDPELLEQRIGRLDRIGQTSAIHLHVPFVQNSPQEVLARWFHEGLDAFRKHLRGGRQLLEQFGRRVHDLAQDFHETQETARGDLVGLLHDSREAAAALATHLEKGRDRLLELNSFRQTAADPLVTAIRKSDQDRTLEQFMLGVFDHFGIAVEEVVPRTYYLGSAGVFADSFPGLPAEGLTVTTNRQRALAREEIQFLTWDHPLVTAALDLILGSDLGSSSFAYWPDTRLNGIYLEAVYVIECVAPAHLHIDRFLPPTPVRVVLDHGGTDVRNSLKLGELRDDQPFLLLDRAEIRDDLLPALIEQAEGLARLEVDAVVQKARLEMAAQLQHEIGRLQELQKVNRNVHTREIQSLVEQEKQMTHSLDGARLRLDAVRVIRRG